MTNDSRKFGFTYGYDDAVTAAMQERTYQWMDIVFVDFGEITNSYRCTDDKKLERTRQ